VLAAALQNRTIEPAEEHSFLALLATAEQLKSATALPRRNAIGSGPRAGPSSSGGQCSPNSERASLRAGRTPPPSTPPRRPSHSNSPASARQRSLASATPRGARLRRQRAERESAQQLMDVITGSDPARELGRLWRQWRHRYFALGHAL
jgi:hypothetical protein